VEGFKIDNSGGEGIVFDATTATVTGKANGYSGRIVNPLSDGLYLYSGSNITLSDVTVKNAGTFGVESQYSTLNATGLKVDGANSSCLMLTDGDYSFDATSEMLTCGGYGIECILDASVEPCPTTLSGVLGEQNGCGCD
jgi:hypothetical protein